MESKAAITAPPKRSWLRRRSKVNLSELIMPAFIVVYSAVIGIIEPRFLSWGNIDNLAGQIAPLLVMAVGQAVTIISGGLDLSMAAVMSLSGVIGILLVPVVGVWGAIAVMAVVGLGIGLTTGYIIAYQRTSPFIVTLGMASVATAVALILAHGVPIYTVPPELTATIGFGHFLGLPVSFEIAVVLLLVGSFLLRRTVFGRYVYAIGSNKSAAIRSGVNVPLYTMLVYGFAGFSAGVASIVLTSWVGAAQPVAEPDMTLKTIAAAVLGGIALNGGSGGMIHVLYGCIVLGALSNSLTLVGVSSFYQILAVGIVIIVAVMLDRVRRREIF
jgi:ribose/xylose/arabinose/galactoside ABC-type transport system permease subunit